ncbi:MAG TPA: hypothetical protein VF766_03275 [Pyrinomonadaceae bacterium]
MSNQKSKIENRKFVMGEHAPGGTRQRVSACRKRLRRTRATQRALKLALDEAVLEASELLKLASGQEDFGDSENVFEEAGASNLSRTRRFTPEVDRRTRLRAR